MNVRSFLRYFITFSILFLFSVFVSAQNHELSKHITKLSEWSGQADVQDWVPEMEIVGQTIHTIWVRYVSGSEGYLYYRRSTDLGETWEAPKLIHTYTDIDYVIDYNHRKLAVEGDKVYIATTDYKYQDKGTGRVFFYESVNAGASFSEGRVLSQNEGGYREFKNCLIKVKNGKIAIAYQGSTSGILKGTRFLFSSNGGASFTDTQISEASDGLNDLFFDGEQAIVLHYYTFFNNGLSVGRVWVSTTNDGKTFTTNKISPKYTTTYGESERCLSRQFENYSSKIAKSGNNIIVVFEGNISEGVWTILSARSTNNGLTFEPSKDLNNGVVRVETPRETVVSANGNFYIAYQSYGKSYKFCFSKSTDSGATFSQPINLMPSDIAHVGYSNQPNIVIDPQDQTGKTLYITGNWFYSIKSTDGGDSFSQYQAIAPSLQSAMYDLSYCSSWMKVDSKGEKHWISSALYRFDKISDILYRNVRSQPEPGIINKSFYVETTKEDQFKLDQIVIPDNPSIRVDSAMTAEVWVRFRTGNDDQYNFTSSIFTKLNGPAGYYDNTPDGYHLAFRKEKNLIQLNSGLKTDKGSFVNWSNIDLNDNLWHHVAITYDARAGKNNYKIYINGLLNKQQTVTGKVYEDLGMLILGSSNMTTAPRQIKYDIDNFRLWNKALSQDEIIGNQTAKLSGKEEGLLLFLNFDDTYKDITGRGNDGIAVYDGRLEQSDFDAPIVAFDVFQSGKTVTIKNNSKNASTWLWNFGDETTSAQGNPVHDYAKAGEYQLSLLAKNTTTVVSSISGVEIKGLSKVEPSSAGNYGYATIVIHGGGLVTAGSTVILKKGGLEIKGTNLYSPAPGQLSGNFKMSGAELGVYDIVVQNKSDNLLLEKAFKVVEANKPEPWVSLEGRGRALFNMWQSYTLNYGNKGNIDALGVPLNIVISDLPGLEIEFIDFKVEANEYIKTNTPELVELMDTLYDVVEDYYGPGLDARFYPLYIPLLEASSSHSIHLRIKSPGDFNIESWTNDPFFELVDQGTKSASSNQADDDDKLQTKLNACIALSALHAFSSIASDGIGIFIPIDCLYDFATVVFNPWDAAKPQMDEPSVFDNWGYSLASAAVSCLGDLNPILFWRASLKITSMVNNMYQGYMAHQDCLNNFDPRYRSKLGVKGVSSFDPNEMVGPSGFGDQNYIVKYDKMPYTILFENKKEATAPAHIVTITDTLDLSTFDIKEFGFGAFGWGDNIYSPQGQRMKEFSKDIDMRPGLELITRVSGKLDTITGVVRWELLSLNPQTMELEEDPFIGFLPPNGTSPQGEGFVSFSVGLKKELKTNDKILNQASIVFDANDPIITNNYLNTLDIDKPESQVSPLQSSIKGSFNVDWSGSDYGSGISEYKIFVLENDTLLSLWKNNTKELSANFEGKEGSTYKFYSIAIDNVSLNEEIPGKYDAQTTILVSAERFEQTKKDITIWPNPIKDKLQLKFADAPKGMFVIEFVGIDGSLKRSGLYESNQLRNGISIDVSDCPRGMYLLRINSGNKNENFKVIIN